MVVRFRRGRNASVVWDIIVPTDDPDEARENAEKHVYGYFDTSARRKVKASNGSGWKFGEILSDEKYAEEQAAVIEEAEAQALAAQMLAQEGEQQRQMRIRERAEQIAKASR